MEEGQFHYKDCVDSQPWSDAVESQVEVGCPELGTGSSDTRCRLESDIAGIGTTLPASSLLACKLVSQPNYFRIIFTFPKLHNMYLKLQLVSSLL